MKENILTLWKEHSASEIAQKLGYPCTRNAVIDVVNRARKKGDKRAEAKKSGSSQPLRRAVTLPTKVKWNDEHERQLRVLVNDGWSAERIGLCLGFHETTVRKYLHKYGLVKKAAPVREFRFQNASTKEQATMARQTAGESLARMEAETGGISMMELKHGQCRGPVGPTEPEQMFCGEKVKAGKSYCEAHHKRYCYPYEHSRRRHKALMKSVKGAI